MDDSRDRLPPPPKDAGAGIGPLTGRIEIALADGARVIVDQEVDGTALARALSVRQNVTALVRQAGTKVAWTGRWIGTILSAITVTLNEIAVIAEDVQARGLEKPGSSGDRQITVFPLRRRDHLPPSVYVGKRSRAGDHPPGEPWYVQWKDERTVRFTFSNSIDVICWLRLSGF